MLLLTVFVCVAVVVVSCTSPPVPLPTPRVKMLQLYFFSCCAWSWSLVSVYEKVQCHWCANILNTWYAHLHSLSNNSFQRAPACQIWKRVLLSIMYRLRCQSSMVSVKTATVSTSVCQRAWLNVHNGKPIWTLKKSLVYNVGETLNWLRVMVSQSIRRRHFRILTVTARNKK